MIKKLKWCIVIMISTVTARSVVNVFGATYIVVGYVVRRIR
jgi:hypothetical protein